MLALDRAAQDVTPRRRRERVEHAIGLIIGEFNSYNHLVVRYAGTAASVNRFSVRISPRQGIPPRDRGRRPLVRRESPGSARLSHETSGCRGRRFSEHRAMGGLAEQERGHFLDLPPNQRTARGEGLARSLPSLAVPRLEGRSGQADAERMTASTDTALLVIDAQESFRQRTSEWAATANPAVLDNIARLVAHARAIGDPVVWITHSEPLDRRNASTPRSDSCGVISELGAERTTSSSCHKTTINAFTSTDLQARLEGAGIRRARDLRHPAPSSAARRRRASPPTSASTSSSSPTPRRPRPSRPAAGSPPSRATRSCAGPRASSPREGSPRSQTRAPALRRPRPPEPSGASDAVHTMRPIGVLDASTNHPG